MLSRSRIKAAMLAAALLLTGCSSQKPAEARTTGVFAMDTYMELKVWCPDGERVLQKASDRISELESTFSVTIPGVKVADGREAGCVGARSAGVGSGAAGAAGAAAVAGAAVFAGAAGAATGAFSSST